MSTAVPCADHAGELVRELVLDLRPERGIKGALSEIAGASGVSFWKLRKLWNPTLQRHGFTWEADEHRDLRDTYFKFIAEQEARVATRLANIRRLRAERMKAEPGDQQLGLDL